MPTDNILMLDGVEYTFDIVLKNEGGSIVLPKILFKELCLKEQFTKWGFKGYLVYENPFEQLERYKANSKTKNSEFFYYRMDGTDEIHITLTPTLKSSGSAKAIRTGKDFPTEMFSLSLVGTIYDSEDLTGTTIDSKQKKLYFWDYYYNKAYNLNTRVSCGDYLGQETGNDKKPPKTIAKLSNSEKQVANGDLLKYIFEKKLKAPVSEDWESGYRKTLYVSNPASTVKDDISHLLGFAHDDKGYPMYLSYDRHSANFNLRSYETIYKNRVSDIREILQFPDSSSANVQNQVHPPRIDTANTFSIPGFSDIQGYKYSKMTANDNMKSVASRSLNGYYTLDGTFKTISKETQVENVKKVFGDLIATFPEGNTNPLMVLNKGKIDNENLIETISYEVKSGLRNAIEAALILNDAVYLDLRGLPHRTPGTFIEIISDSDTEGIWEDRFLGTWFILDVEHKVGTSTYTNKVLAVKINMSNAFTYPDGTEIEKQEIETIK